MTKMLTRQPSVLLAAKDDDVAACLERMAGAKVGSIVVVENDRPVGIFTERDALRSWKAMGVAEFLNAPIGGVASQPVFCLKLAELAHAPREMIERHIRHVPLVDDDGKLVGIMSMRDVLAAQLKAGTLGTLTPVRGKAARTPQVGASPPAADVPAGEPTLHLLAPTAQLTDVCRQFLPDGWHLRVWNSVASIENLPEVKAGESLRKLAFVLDLDGVKDANWKGLIKTFIKMLAGADQPAEVVLVFTPKKFREKDVQSLTAVAAKAKWVAIHRPLPIQQLGEEIAGLA